MAEKISFTSCELLGYHRNSAGGRAFFKSPLNKTVMAKLEWSEVPECVTGSKLEGELDCTQIELTPQDAQLKRHAISLDTTRIKGFQTVRLELPESRGKGHRTELRFVVYFSDVKGGKKLEEYILTAGKSTLSCNYTRQPTQGDLPGTEAKADEQGELAVQ